MSSSEAHEATHRRPVQVGRLGIRAKLFIAFCGFAGLTIVASLVAWLVFTTIERSVDQVTQQSVPGMVDALGLAKKVADIAAAAPKLVTSSSVEQLAAERARLAGDLREFAQFSAALDQEGLFAEGGNTVGGLADQLEQQLVELQESVERRLDLKQQRIALSDAAQQAHARFSERLEPLIDNAVFDLVIRGERVMLDNSTSTTNLVETGVADIDQLLSIKADINLAAGLIAEAVAVTDPVQLEPIEERFLSAAYAIDRELGKLPDSQRNQALREVSHRLLELGRGSANVFMARKSELTTKSSDNLESGELKQRLETLHSRVLLALTPMVDDATFDLVLTTERVTQHGERALSGLIEGNVNTLNRVLTLRAEGNLAASLLSDAAVLSNERHFTPLKDRFIATEARILTLLQQTKDASYHAALSEVTGAVLAFGNGEESLFELRANELHEERVGQSLLDQSQALALKLSDRVAGIVTQARLASDAASSESKRAIDTGQLVLLLITVAGLIGASMAMFLYVGPRIIQPISRITSAMTELADGDTDVVIPAQEHNDELGSMARALGVFRDNAIAIQEANRKELQSTRRQLAEAIESINEGFCYYDAEDRLVLYNRRYLDLLFPGMDEPVAPGATFESVVRKAVSLGLVIDAQNNDDNWVRQRLTKHQEAGPPHVQQTSDGNYLMISERRTDDGGTVGIYSDITQLKQRESELGKKSRELELLANQLSKYLSPQVYESIFSGRQEVKVTSQRKKLTVFFSDIANFTETAERLQSEDLTFLLNEYLTEMSKIALNYGATIDKYVGDAIVIFFGDPESKGVKQDALNCVEMAVAMRAKMEELRSNWQGRGVENPLQCRMGINTGYCTVGNFGSEARMDYTIIGAGVNLASRLETAAAPGEILLSHETHALVRERVMCEARPPTKIKGMAKPVTAYQVIDLISNLEKQDQRVRTKHLNMRLEMNPAAMSDSERAEAQVALREALKRLK